jgi:hypothetical protein
MKAGVRVARIEITAEDYVANVSAAPSRKHLLLESPEA